MSHDEVFGRGMRSPIKTKAIAEHDAQIQKSNQNRETRRRTKQVNEQEQDLVEQEKTLEEMEAEIVAAEKLLATQKLKAKKLAASKAAAPKQPSNSKTSLSKSVKSKDTNSGSSATATAGSRAPAIKYDTREEADNHAALQKYEEDKEQLVNILFWRDRMDRGKLELMDLEELQVLYQAGLGAAPAPAKQKKTKATSSAAAKTPAAKRVKASAVMSSTIEMLGSPLNALKEAREQAERADPPTPLPAKGHKRDLSAALNEEANKRARVEAQNSKPLRPPVKPKPKTSSSRAGTPSSVSVIARSASQPNSRVNSRAGSLAPTVNSIRTASSRPAAPPTIPENFPPDFGNEDFEGLMESDEELGAEADEESEEEGEEEEAQVKGQRSKSKARKSYFGKAPPKDRPSMALFKGEEGKIVDEAFLQITRLLFLENMCPLGEEYSDFIARGWHAAVTGRGHDISDWPKTQEHETVLRQRLNSYRGRVRDRVLDVAINTYDLRVGPKRSLEDIKDHAAALLPDAWHTDPEAEAKLEGTGGYQHPFLALAIYQAFYRGQKSVGVKCKQDFDVMPISTISFICGLTTYLLGRYREAGFYDTKQKMDITCVRKPAGKHVEALEKFQTDFPKYFLVNVQEGLAYDAKQYAGQAAERRRSKAVVNTSTFARVVELTDEQVAELRAKRNGGRAPTSLAIRPPAKQPAQPASSITNAGRVQGHVAPMVFKPAIDEDEEMLAPAEPSRGGRAQGPGPNNDEDDLESVVAGTDGEMGVIVGPGGRPFVTLDGSSELSSDEEEAPAKKRPAGNPKARMNMVQSEDEGEDEDNEDEGMEEGEQVAEEDGMDGGEAKEEGGDAERGRQTKDGEMGDNHVEAVGTGETDEGETAGVDNDRVEEEGEGVVTDAKVANPPAETAKTTCKPPKPPCVAAPDLPATEKRFTRSVLRSSGATQSAEVLEKENGAASRGSDGVLAVLNKLDQDTIAKRKRKAQKKAQKVGAEEVVESNGAGGGTSKGGKGKH
ncbi:hypothetical protein FRC09_011010 [Ceratobasidium sp. 395]|nr:hypothetical protein FRC09_011010 [Ceratobasidium sp. 395]